MTEEWDATLKILLKERPQDVLNWLMPGARYKRSVSPHLPGRKIDADVLDEVIQDEKVCLWHVEFQSYRDPDMAKRLWEYNVRATLKYNLPVKSFVIYLRKTRKIAQSPYVWTLPDGQEVHRFHFTVIKLAEVKAETLQESGLVGLLPLVPLTQGGNRREVVDELITKIQTAGGESASELLSLTYILASFVFKKTSEREWLDRRFSMVRNILRDAWAYQEIKKEGLLEGRQEALQEQRRTLLEIVQARFPALESQARKKADAINKLAALRSLIVQVSLAQNEEAAKQALRSRGRKKN